MKPLSRVFPAFLLSGGLLLAAGCCQRRGAPEQSQEHPSPAPAARQEEKEPSPRPAEDTFEIVDLEDLEEDIQVQDPVVVGEEEKPEPADEELKVE